jgi:hypothetical protein
MEITHFHLTLKMASPFGSLLCFSGAAVIKRRRTHVSLLVFLHDKKVFTLHFSKDAVGNKKKQTLIKILQTMILKLCSFEAFAAPISSQYFDEHSIYDCQISTYVARVFVAMYATEQELRIFI